jgi:hypothetical protein
VVGEQVDQAVEKAPSAPRLWKPLALCTSVQVICYVRRSNLAMRMGMSFWALFTPSLLFKPAPQFLFSPFFRVGLGFLLSHACRLVAGMLSDLLYIFNLRY